VNTGQKISLAQVAVGLAFLTATVVFGLTNLNITGSLEIHLKIIYFAIYVAFLGETITLFLLFGRGGK
jgi:hypothetical protein